MQVVEEDLRSLIFGDYMNPDLERVYEEISRKWLCRTLYHTQSFSSAQVFLDPA